jgi:hypothetical protein
MEKIDELKTFLVCITSDKEDCICKLCKKSNNQCC